MTTQAIHKHYRGEVRDRRENFGGNILVYIGWDEHLLFCSAHAFPLSPHMTFQDLYEQVLPQGFAQHPDFEHIEKDKIEWTLNGKLFQPVDDQTLEQQGFDHKSLLRFKTLGLNGWQGSGV